MNQPRDPDAIIATWLDDGPIDLPEETRRAIVVGLRIQPRARRMAILRGLPVNPLTRFIAAAAIVLAVGGLSIFVLANRGGGGPGANPSAPVTPSASSPLATSPAPSIAPSPSLLSTAGWVTFTSSRYEYQIERPPTWTVEPAARDWVFATDRLLSQADGMNGSADHFNGGPDGNQVGVTVFAVDVPAGKTADQWIMDYYQAEPDPNCRLSLDALAAVTVDGRAGRIGTSPCSESQAFVFIGSRVFVLGVWREDQEPLLRAFLSTFTFLPGGPAGSSGGSPAPS